MTEFESFTLSEYLVGTWLVRIDKSKLNEFTIISKSSLIKKWYKKDGSQRLSQMLKSPVIIRRLQMSTLASFRYFKAKWEESE